VTSDLSRRSGGWAVIVLVAAALSLGACGRKGALDLPPTAYSPTASAVPTDGEARAASESTAFETTSDAAAAAPKGKKKPFILDPLLAN
jgi:predicted small lipoprotein YifL